MTQTSDLYTKKTQQVSAAKKNKLITPFRALMIHSVLFFGVLFLLVLTENNQLLLLENGSWTELPRLSESVKRVEVSKQGTLWAQMNGAGGFSRYDNGKWTSFSLTDFTSKSDDLLNFTLSEDGLWAVTEKNVFFFDGVKWHGHSGVRDRHEKPNIAAWNNHVWIIGSGGKIHHFNGSEWEILQDKEHLRWGDSTAVRIFSDAAGDLWVARHNVWKKQGFEWKKIVDSTDLIRPQFIGIVGDNLWLKERLVPRDKWSRDDGEKIAKVSLQDNKITVFSLSELGISEDAEIGAMIANGEMLVHAPEKLVAYKDDKWRELSPLPPLPDDFYKLIKIEPYGKNRFIALAEVNLGIISILADNLIYVMCFFLPIMFAILGWLGWSERKKKAEEAAMIKQTRGMNSATNEFIHERKKDARLSTRMGITILLFLLIIPISLLVTSVMDVLEYVADYSIVLAVVGYVLFFILIIILGTSLLAAPIYYILMPLRRGNYDLAIFRAIKMHKIHRLCADELHGTVLMYAGRLGEAEEVFRKYLAEKAALGNYRGSEQISSLVAAYARTLLWSGRIEEAETENQKAIEMTSKHHEGLLGLAETYLCRKNQALKALPLIEKAMALQKLDRLFCPHQWLRIYSAHAWALAQLERYDQAEQSLRLALKKGGRKLIPEVALLHLRGSIVYGLQGKKDLSHAELQKAFELDPKGFVGQKAKEAMPKQRVGQFDYGV